MTNERCETCRWWWPESDDKDQGECMRTPPSGVAMMRQDYADKVMGSDNTDMIWIWPMTLPDHFCSGYEPEPVPQPQRASFEKWLAEVENIATLAGYESYVGAMPGGEGRLRWLYDAAYSPAAAWFSEQEIELRDADPSGPRK